jgi:hypothetical protein
MKKGTSAIHGTTFFFIKRGIKKPNFVEDHPMIIPVQFGLNCPCGFREEAF